MPMRTRRPRRDRGIPRGHRTATLSLVRKYLAAMAASPNKGWATDEEACFEFNRWLLEQNDGSGPVTIHKVCYIKSIIRDRADIDVRAPNLPLVSVGRPPNSEEALRRHHVYNPDSTGSMQDEYRLHQDRVNEWNGRYTHTLMVLKTCKREITYLDRELARSNLSSELRYAYMASKRLKVWDLQMTEETLSILRANRPGMRRFDTVAA